MERGSLSLPSGKSEYSGVHGGQWLPPQTRIKDYYGYEPLRASEAHNMRKMSYDKMFPSGVQPSPYNLPYEKLFSQYINQQGVHHAPSSRSSVQYDHGIGREDLFQMAPQYSTPVPTIEQCFRQQQQQQCLQREIGTKKPSSVPESSSGSFSQWNTATQQVQPSQLTIFYKGAVLVYDDISLHHAKEIMLVANKRSKLAAPVDQPRQLLKAQKPFDALEIQQQRRGTSNCSDDHSAPISLTLTIGSQSVSHEDTVMLNTSRPSSSAAYLKVVDATVESGCSSASMPGAIPQARKASIARFLEKRRDRLINCTPFSYGSSKKSS